MGEEIKEEQKVEIIVEEVPVDLPPDIPQDMPVDTPPEDTPEQRQEISKEIKKEAEFHDPKSEIQPKTQEVLSNFVKSSPPKENNINQSTEKKEEMVELREIEIGSLGIKELDYLFKQGLPKICNMLFAGIMSTGKTLMALRLILATAKKGERALYLSLHDSEEKIINILKSLDKEVLNYINSGNITIRKLDTFQIAMKCHIKKAEIEKNPDQEFNCDSFFDYTKEYSPNLVVVDSLSALELSFSDDKNCYRHYIDAMFKYFERLGVRAIYIKELIKEEDLHKEFFENILADCILYFYLAKNNKSEIKVVKEYPIPSNNVKKGLFSIHKK